MKDASVAGNTGNVSDTGDAGDTGDISETDASTTMAVQAPMGTGSIYVRASAIFGASVGASVVLAPPCAYLSAHTYCLYSLTYM